MRPNDSSRPKAVASKTRPLDGPAPRYHAHSFAMLGGYPKRTTEVFYKANGEIDAAFDSKLARFQVKSSQHLRCSQQ